MTPREHAAARTGSFHLAFQSDAILSDSEGDEPKEGVENDTRNLTNGDAIQIWTALKQR
jgi:hypothetical protein